jgi:hypothetical protein
MKKKENLHGVFCGHRFYPKNRKDNEGIMPVLDTRTRSEIETFFEEEEQRRIDNNKLNNK